jgi:PAS domain S-box-containing protein
MFGDDSTQQKATAAGGSRERRRFDEQLQYQASLLDNVSDAVISSNANGVIQSWNRAAEAMYGWPAEEVIGRPSVAILQTEYPSDGKETVSAKLLQEGVWRGELVQKRKDGSRIRVLASVSLLHDSKRNHTGTVTINRDITEIKREEERQSFLAKASETLASSLDYETTLASVAQLAVPTIANWCTVYLVEEDGSLSEVALAHVDPDKIRWAQELRRKYAANSEGPASVAQVVRTGRPAFMAEIKEDMIRAAVQDPDLLKILLELEVRSSMTVPLTVAGRTLGAITFAATGSSSHYTQADLAFAEELARRAAIAVDHARLYSSAQKLNEELERRVEKRTAQLEATNKELEAFSYSVSHDLRAPLSHIGGFVELLQKDLQPTMEEKHRRYLDHVAAAAERMGTLIDDLLSLSRVGRTDLAKTRFDMEGLVRDVISYYEPEARGRQIAWRIGTLPSVYADRSMVNLVWQNLVSNALKYTRPRAQAEIEIGYYPDGRNQVFFIKDNGVGFDMKYVDKLFGVFQRLHSVAEFEGTGIGLANVRRIVSRHSGETWAEGSRDGGAAFYFTLPAEEG